jgi:hypothetical protein
MVSEHSTDSNESAPVTTESVRYDSITDSNGSENNLTREPTHQASQFEADKPRAEPSSSSGSEDDLVTPHHSVHLVKPQPYIPARVADIETQVPSFSMPSPGRETSDFPSIVPGPLPALAKAPIAAWSKPFAPKAIPPPDRPLDVQAKQFEPYQTRIQGTTTSASPRQTSNRWPTNYNDQPASDDWNTGSRRASPTTRRPWSERSAEPKKRNLGFDTAAYRAKYADRNPETPETEIKRGLEPIYDSNDNIGRFLPPLHLFDRRWFIRCKVRNSSRYARSSRSEVQGRLYGQIGQGEGGKGEYYESECGGG